MAPNNTYLNSKYFIYLIKQTFMCQCIHSVTLVQICYKQLIFSTAERCSKRARTFKIKFKKPYNPRLLAEEKRGGDRNNVSRTLVFANSTCSSQILHLHLTAFLSPMCFILLLLTQETQDILAFLYLDLGFTFPDTFKFWKFFIAQNMAE